MIAFLEQAIEALLRCWLIHSRGVRLSVLEAVDDRSRWHELKQFIERYGHDLFTQRFMNHGNLRGILHQGVDAWLKLARRGARRRRAASACWTTSTAAARAKRPSAGSTVALEAVVENYAEYVDYNSTTTQSDRGDMLYTLLDYLRLRASYDRVAWNLQPVVLAHEVLVRGGHDEAADVLAGCGGRADVEHRRGPSKRFERLNRKYGMRLPSIADRLGERFVRPWRRSALRPGPTGDGGAAAPGRPGPVANRRPRAPVAAERSATFRRLEEGIAQFTREISGAGFDLPAWLEALEQEVDRAQLQAPEDEDFPGPELPVPTVRLWRGRGAAAGPRHQRRLIAGYGKSRKPVIYFKSRRSVDG